MSGLNGYDQWKTASPWDDDDDDFEMDFPKLEIVGDGSHHGLTDWYPKVEEAIVEALAAGQPFTTGWYGSKKEIASARITYTGESIVCEASVSNDFDEAGTGSVSIPFTKGLQAIKDAINEAWGKAETEQDGNAQVRLWAILKDNKWVESYLQNIGEDWADPEHPPGDFYECWGFQGEADIPEDIKAELERLILSGETTAYTVGDYSTNCDN